MLHQGRAGVRPGVVGGDELKQLEGNVGSQKKVIFSARNRLNTRGMPFSEWKRYCSQFNRDGSK